MWENAAPLPENEPPRPPARRAGSEEDFVLRALNHLCLAAIVLVLAAGALDWPIYPELRRAFTAAMQPEQSLLLGEERNIETPIAGTTRDSIHTRYNKFGMDFYLVDTAGMRKKGKTMEDLEFYSVLRSIRAIENSDVCILMIDARQGLES